MTPDDIGPTPADPDAEDEGAVTLDSVVSDYCRTEEETAEEDDEAMAQWEADLDSVAHLGATYQIHGDNEIHWQMPLRAVFALRLCRDWFRDGGFYGPDVFRELAQMLDGVRNRWPKDMSVFDGPAEQIRLLWEAFASAEAAADAGPTVPEASDDMTRSRLSRAARLWRTGSLYLVVALAVGLFGTVVGALCVWFCLYLWRVLAG